MSGLSREEAKHHVVIYVRVFAALLALTAVTVGISYLRLPLPQAVTLALAIAAFKVSLVAAFFMHLAGEKDTLVKYAWQTRMMEAVRRLNGCDSVGQPWGTNATLYPSKTGTPVVTFIHPGAHEFKPAAPALIVKFFKEHPAESK